MYTKPQLEHSSNLFTLVELLHGAEKSSRGSESLFPIEDLCSRLEVLLYGSKAAQHYGASRVALEKLGHPIGVNDLLIAAHARSGGLARVTNKASEFVRVPALEVENWVQPGR
jgi:tRNA(fMet)-specific endonuclease VapC